MSLRDKVTSQQLLAVSLAVIMLLSVGGMAFAGGVGAQTGGTYDSVVDSTDVGNDVNIDNDSAVKTLGAASVNGDGSVAITGDTNTFDGVAVTPDRIDTLFDVSASPDNPADFLDASPSEITVSDGATPNTANGTIFVEFDPQSEFSQIEPADSGSDGVAGDHDYIVVTTAGEAEELTGDAPASLGGGVDPSNIVALSVNNGAPDDYSLLAAETDYETVFDNLVGTNEADLQNKNIDDTLFAAGTFDDNSATITAFDVGDGENSRLVHSEQVTLDPEGTGTYADYQFYTSVSGAVGDATAGAGDVITVTGGPYNSTDGNAADDAVDANENGLTIIGENNPTLDGTSGVDITANNVTFDGLTIDNDEATALDVTGDDPTVLNSTVNAGDTDTGVSVDSGGEVTLEGNDLNADDTSSLTTGDIGLDLVSVGTTSIQDNTFDGFRTQIQQEDSVDATALRDNNTFEQLAVPVNASDNVVSDTGDIFGSIELAANDAGAANNTTAVSAGTYGESPAVSTDNVTIVGDDGAVIDGSVTFDSADSVTLRNFDVNEDVNVNTDGQDLNPLVTIEDVTLPGSTVTVDDASDVTVENVVLENAGADGILIDDETDDVYINGSDVLGLTSGTAVDVVDAAGNATVSNVTVTGDDLTAGTEVGINVAGINTTAAEDSYTIQDNDLTSLGDATGIAVSENGDVVDNPDGTVAIEANEIHGGDSLTGIEYDLANSSGVVVFQNEIIGANVQNGENSVGIDVLNIREEATDDTVLGTPQEDDGPQFAENTLSGHARIVDLMEANDGAVSFEYNQFRNESVFNNTVGTLVTGPEDAAYEDTFGNLEAGYLPGSVSEAVDLAERKSVESADLQVYDPTLEGVDAAPDTYVDDEVVFDDADTDDISVSGQDKTVTVETHFDLKDTTGLDNHDVTDLTIVNTGNGAPAIDVQSENAQSTFEGLDVTSDNVGLNVDTDGTDVNVVTVTDSIFNVSEGTSSGIVLAGEVAGEGTDDRDGYNLTNVTVTGPGISETATGLDLTGIDKPGKDNLAVNLSVTETEVNGFQKQVLLSDSLANIDGLNASAVYEGTFTATDQVDVEFTDNSFEHAVLVLEEDANGDETLAENETLYGSIATAQTDGGSAGVQNVSADAEVAIIDVRGTATYAEAVTLGATTNENAAELLVRGPQHDTQADSTFRGAVDGSDEAIIDGQVDITTNYDDGITLTGFTAVSDAGSTINLNNDAPVDINNTAVSSTGDTDTTGINVDGVTDANTVDLTGVFVGDHGAQVATTTNTSVAISNSAPVTITESTLDSSATSGDGVNTDSGEVTITDSRIANHDETGVDATTTGDGVTISNTTVVDNGDGVDATGDAVAVTIKDESTIDNNQVEFNNSNELNVTESTVRNYDGDNGAVQIDDADPASTITQTTFESNDISIGVEAVATDLTVQNNAFNSGTTAIENNDGELDATLNYYGARDGPSAATTPNITGSATTDYDPFLTTDQTGSDDVTTTTDFGHDVVITPGDGFTTVGVPAEHEADNLGELFGGDANSFGFEGEVYAFDAQTETFSGADPGDNVSAFDAYVVDLADSQTEDVSFLIEYESNPQAAPVNTQLQDGLNFVAPPAASSSDIFNQDVDNGDTVQERFGLGDNLYGDGAPSNTNFANPDERFTDGDGTQEVHPHAGYFVTIQEDSQNPIVSDRIFPGVTYDQIEDDTDETA